MNRSASGVVRRRFSRHCKIVADQCLIGVSSEEHRIVVLSGGGDQAFLAPCPTQIRGGRKQQGISP
jgi:hypothetical protein